MKKETKSNVKSDIATGMSSAVGATIGMVAGSSISASATEIPEPIEPVVNTEEPQVQVITSEPERPTEVQTETPTVQPTSPTESEVAVLGYETVTNDDGSQMDVAVVSIDGQQAIIADIDMDGNADVIAADANANGYLDNNEFVDVSGQGLTMAPFQDACMEDDHSLIAQNSDYVNDADVTDYMA